MFAEKGVILLPSPEAYEKMEWTREHFGQKPVEGYFIWVKKQVSYPISTCIAISSPEVYQKPRNLVIVEKGVKAEVYSICNAVKPNLSGKHVGYSKIILRENSTLKIRHFHKWGRTDEVSSVLDFLLEKGATAFSFYKSLAPPEKLTVENRTVLDAYSSANFEKSVLAKNGEVKLYDSIFLNGEKSSGIVKLRMVSGENSSIDSIPELLNSNKNAVLTHEASIGKVSEEELNYLRSRGLTEDEAINLIVTGFLGEALTYKEYSIPAESHM